MSALAYDRDLCPAPARSSLRRPRLRAGLAVVWREPGVLQLGLSGEVVLLEGLPRGADRALASLDGRRTVEEVSAQEGPWATGLIEALDAEGLLVDGPERPGAGGRVRVLGAGRLALGLVELLVDAQVDVVVTDPSPVPRSRLQSLTAAARRLGAVAVEPCPGRDGAIRSCLTVVAPSTCEPDRVLTDRLVRGDTPHVVVRVQPSEAIVGPFVIPGATSCLRCADLARSAIDPGWRRVALELTCQAAPNDRLLESWAVSVAAAQVVAHLSGSGSELESASLHLDRATGRTSLRRWPSHPRCGCRDAA